MKEFEDYFGRVLNKGDKAFASNVNWYDEEIMLAPASLDRLLNVLFILGLNFSEWLLRRTLDNFHEEFNDKDKKLLMDLKET